MKHYDLADRARTLGWTQVEVIDADLGISADEDMAMTLPMSLGRKIHRHGAGEVV